MKSNAYMLIALAVSLVAHVSAETIVGVSDQNSLVTIDSVNPSVVVNSAPITGVQAGENIVSLDSDENTAQLFGLSNLDRLYRIDPVTGVASLINAAPIKNGIIGDIVSLEVDPILGDLRILDNTGLNAVLDPVIGLLQGLLGGFLYPIGDPNFLQIPSIIEAAFDNFHLDEDQGILYLTDRTTGDLVQVVNGLLTTLLTIGPLEGIDLNNLIGFDIGTSGTGLLAVLLPNNGGTNFYLVNLLNGSTELLGLNITLFRDITILSPPPPNPDSDGDGVPNASDRCPDTPAGQIIDQFGCSIDQLCPCSGPRTGGTYPKKGYSKCVNAQAKRFQKAGVITKVEKKTITKGSKTSPCNR